MKFDNLIAYCKNWYEHRGDVDEMWKDMAHCIMCDGYMCFSKSDVAQRCMHIMECFANEHPNEAYKVSFSAMFYLITHNKNIVRVSGREMNLDDYDHICWAFRDVFMWVDAKLFDVGVIPSTDVLPINPNIGEEVWQRMMEEYSEQNKKYWVYETYDEREKHIQLIKSPLNKC